MDNIPRKNFIQRQIFKDLKEHLQKREITLLIGPRQVGKTTLMKELQVYLENKGEKTLFLNMDFETDRQHFQSQEALIYRMQLEFGNKRGYVFLDEIQRRQDAGLFLKGIFDKNLPYKLIVSGSGSVELKEKIHESLAGRKLIFEIFPVNFFEFLNFKTEYRYQYKLRKFIELEKKRSLILLEEYLNFGGYPRVILSPTFKEKSRIIDEIYQSYLEKDVSMLLNIEKVEAFSSLIKILASQVGNQINYSEISNTLGLSFATVKNYFWYLEKTFILERITPFFKNVRKEITKSPVVYFRDFGLRNWSVGLLGGLTLNSNPGLVFENFIFNILKESLRHQNINIHYWRTKDGAEVDLVLSKGQEIIPIEVKYNLKKPTVPGSLLHFIQRYKPRRAFVVNFSLAATIKRGNTKIHFIPFFRLESVMKTK